VGGNTRSRAVSVLAGLTLVSLMVASALVPGVEEFLNFWVSLIGIGGSVLALLGWIGKGVWDEIGLDREIAEANRVNARAALPVPVPGEDR
jgi:hypothetical protein